MSRTPHNDTAERAVIAHLLQDTDGTATDQAVGKGLSRDSFYDYRYGTMFAACQSLRGKSLVPDLISVCTELAASGDLDRIGGPALVSSFSLEYVGVMAFEQHVELVVCLAAQRKALSAARDVVNALEADYVSRDDMHAAVVKPLAGVENAMHAQAKVRTVSHMVDDAYAKALRRIENSNDIQNKITTGLLDFDRYATPIEPHELVVIGARPSKGKSSLSRQIAWHNAKLGKRVAVFVLETSDTAFVESCAAQEARISVKSIHEEMPDRHKAYVDALKRIKSMDNLKVYDHDMDIASIESRCRVLSAAWAPDLVVVDYLQIIRGRKTGVSTADAIADITMRFVGLVKLLGCPIILMSQLTRAGERDGNRDPMLSDLRDSGAIESDAHRIVFIHRPDKDRDNIQQNDDAYRDEYDCKLIQAKLRDGPLSCVWVKFKSRWATFENYA